MTLSGAVSAINAYETQQCGAEDKACAGCGPNKLFKRMSKEEREAFAPRPRCLSGFHGQKAQHPVTIRRVKRKAKLLKSKGCISKVQQIRSPNREILLWVHQPQGPSRWPH